MFQGCCQQKSLSLGGGVVGTNAVRVAMGMGANVVVIDKSLERLNHLDLQFGSQINTVFSTTDSIEEHVLNADLVIGAVLIPGASAPTIGDKKNAKPYASRFGDCGCLD